MYRKLRIVESNYGRDFGWYVERDGRRLAALTEPWWEDQFWFSYRVEPLTDDPATLEELRSDGFWQRFDRLVFRSREFGTAIPYAFPGGIPGQTVRESGRVSMRGLYVPVRCYPWDSLLLWLWRRVKKAGRGR